MGESPLHQRGIDSGISGAEVHAPPETAGPDQPGGALLDVRRTRPHGSSHGRRQTGGRREDAAQPGGKRPGDRRDPGRGVRPRPARTAAARPHHQRHSGDHAAPGLRGTRRQTLPHAGGVQGRRPPAAHHRKNRFPRGTPRRRIVADGGRAPARWLARQRGDSAGGGGRPAALHPPFRPPRAQGRGPGGEVRHDRRHAGTLERLRQGAPQHPDLRRYGLRQDHPAQRRFFLHPGRRAHRDH